MPLLLSVTHNRDTRRIVSFFTWEATVRSASRLCCCWDSADPGSIPSSPQTDTSTLDHPFASWASFCLRRHRQHLLLQPDQKEQNGLGPQKHLEKCFLLFMFIISHLFMYIFSTFQIFFFPQKKKLCITNLVFLPALTHWLAGKLT